MKTELLNIPHHALHPNPYQPRKLFVEAHLNELASSIKEHGIIEPLIVRKKMDDFYEIIAGERRWRAAKLANLDNLPCLVRQYSDKEAAVLSIIENIQRDNLHVIEEAEGYKRLLLEFDYLQETIAEQVGKSRSHIANMLRLLTLPSFVQEKLLHDEITAGHARSLLGLDESLQRFFMNQIIEKKWSVRQLEKAVKSVKIDSFPKTPKKNEFASLTHFESQLSLQLGAPVSLEYEKAPAGWLKIKFFDHETLEGLLERLGLSYD